VSLKKVLRDPDEIVQNRRALHLFNHLVPYINLCKFFIKPEAVTFGKELLRQDQEDFRELILGLPPLYREPREI